MKYKITYQKDGKSKILKSDSLENLPDNIIKIQKSRAFPTFQLRDNNKKSILNMFEQLNIMLNANITFNEAIELSLKNEQEKIVKKILTIMQSAITSGQPIDQALHDYKNILGETSLLFLKLGIQNGNIKQSINSLTQLLQEDMKIKTKFNDTLRYPKLLIGSLILSLCMVFIYVVPNFEYIFTMNQDQIPLSTKILLGINNLFENYLYMIIIGVVGLIFLLYGVYRKFLFFFHKLLITKVPILSDVLKDYYFYRLFLLISIIVNSKYQFQVAIENSQNLISNLYVKKMIQTIISDIKNGRSISKAFEKTKLFDSLTIQLLFTAEHTASYETILDDITLYYKQKFQTSLKLFSSYIEPIIVLIIALVVLWLMLAIMTPIWNMSTFLS
jgi:general secretion pathway protein F